MSPGSSSERLRGSSRRAKATRALIFATLLISAASCLAPGLYASTDCDRWIKEYRQGLLQARAARRLRLAKARLLTVVHRAPATPPRKHIHHRMGPLEALRRFQVDCGALDEPEPAPLVVSFPFLPVETLPLEETTIAEVATPVLVQPPVPNLLAPVQTAVVSVPAAIPEPASLLLVLTGIGAGVYVYRRRAVTGLHTT